MLPVAAQGVGLMGPQGPQQAARQSRAALKGWLVYTQQVCLLLCQRLTGLLSL